MDLQAFLNAPTRLDEQGNYTYIQNPVTGQWEIAYGGFSNPATFQPQVTQGSSGTEYIDPATGRLVTQNENATGMEWVYADDWTPVPGQQQSGFALPKSVAEQVFANPSAYGDVTVSGFGPVQQPRGGGFGEFLRSGDWIPGVGAALVGAAGLSGFGTGQPLFGGAAPTATAANQPMLPADAGTTMTDVGAGMGQVAQAYNPMADPSVMRGIASQGPFYDLSGLGAAAGGAAGGLTAGQALSGTGSLGTAVGGLGNALGGVGSALGTAGGLAALGGAAGLLGGSKQAGVTTTVQDIPDWLKPYATNMLNSAQGQFQASQTPNPLLGQAQGEMAKTIGGGYLMPENNPFLRVTYDQAAKAVTDNYLSTTQPRTDALFARAGAFGPSNSAYRETVARNQFGLGQNLTNLATNLYGGNYQSERGRQFGATSAAPDFASSSTGAGFAPFNQYAGLLKGWGSQTQQPFYENKLAQAAGGALSGYTLGKLFG